MSLASAVLLLTTVLGGLALVFLGLRAYRAMTEARPPAVEAPDLAQMLGARIEGMLGEQERRLTEAFAAVREDLSGLKTDVEWLAGERMIEQAIALAQTGSDPDEIGQELGLSRDAAATIAMFRKH